MARAKATTEVQRRRSPRMGTARTAAATAYSGATKPVMVEPLRATATLVAAMNRIPPRAARTTQPRAVAGRAGPSRVGRGSQPTAGQRDDQRQGDGAGDAGDGQRRERAQGDRGGRVGGAVDDRGRGRGRQTRPTSLVGTRPSGVGDGGAHRQRVRAEPVRGQAIRREASGSQAVRPPVAASSAATAALARRRWWIWYQSRVARLRSLGLAVAVAGDAGRPGPRRSRTPR